MEVSFQNDEGQLVVVLCARGLLLLFRLWRGYLPANGLRRWTQGPFRGLLCSNSWLLPGKPISFLSRRNIGFSNTVAASYMTYHSDSRSNRRQWNSRSSLLGLGQRGRSYWGDLRMKLRALYGLTYSVYLWEWGIDQGKIIVVVHDKRSQQNCGCMSHLP